MYFLDPSTGRRRRQVAREQAYKLLRRGARDTAARGVTEGEIHEFRAERTQPGPSPDDVTLVDRVQSVIFRDPSAPRGSVIVNAENGVIYLRGEVASAELAERMAFATRSVDGVLGVKNLLHLPGERSPTAEDTRNSP
jgi:osmotically-inducible protein OsmY